jgi:hypothetical protein
LTRRKAVAGCAALLAAATFIFGFALAASVLRDYVDDPAPPEAVRLVAEHEPAVAAWYLVTLVGFGIVLVTLVLTIRDHVEAGGRAVVQSATAFGLIWATLAIAAGMIGTAGVSVVADLQETAPRSAIATWSALEAVRDGMRGSIEIVGALWVLIVSLAGWRAATLPRGLCVLGGAAGLSGAVTAVPGGGVMGALFGITMIGWFIWVGVVLIQCARREEQAEPNPSVASADDFVVAERSSLGPRFAR